MIRPMMESPCRDRLQRSPAEGGRGGGYFEGPVGISPEFKAILRKVDHLQKFEHPRTKETVFRELPDDLDTVVTPELLTIISEKYLSSVIVRKVQLGVVMMCTNPTKAWRLRSRRAMDLANDMAMKAYDVVAGESRNKLLTQECTLMQLRGFLRSLSGGWRADYALKDICIEEWRELTYQQDGREPKPISRDIARLWRRNGVARADITKAALLQTGYSKKDAENLKAPPKFLSPYLHVVDGESEISAFEMHDVVKAKVEAGESRDSMPPDDRMEEDLSYWLRVLVSDFLRYDFIKFGLESRMRELKSKLDQETNIEKSDELSDDLAIYALELEFHKSTEKDRERSRLSFLRQKGFNDVDTKAQMMTNRSASIRRPDRRFWTELKDCLPSRPLVETYSTYGTSVAAVCARIDVPKELVDDLERVIPGEYL